MAASGGGNGQSRGLSTGERIHLKWIEDARRGLDDIAAGRTFEADAAIEKLQRQRQAAAASDSAVRRPAGD